MSKGKKPIMSAWIKLAILLAILVLANVFMQQQNNRWDLTEEKRFTLSPTTKKIAASLDQPVDIYVFLENDELPSGFKRLRQATRDLLRDLQSVSRGKIKVYFEDPLEGLVGEEREQTTAELRQRGVIPTNAKIKTKDGFVEKTIFPAALINYGEKQIPVQLLAGERGQDDLLRSEALLEYKFANALDKLNKESLPVVGFLGGHGELAALEINDLQASLFEQLFFSQEIILDSLAVLPTELDALVIAKPTKAFTEEEKFKIDQYVMNGGKTLWMLDMMKMDLDSLRQRWGGSNVAVDHNLNLDDILFTYGVRLNRDLVRDMQSKPVPIVVDESGQTQLIRWTLYPVVTGQEHVITSNINPVSLEFSSSIDVLNVPKLKTTPLLVTSGQSGVVANPVYVSLEELRTPPPPEAFGRTSIPLAVLVEGRFPSLYKNRASPIDGARSPIEESAFNKMVIIADGDIARNPVLPGNQTLPLGYDRALRQTFGNKAFLLNAIEYLVNGDDVLLARNKEVELRLLNQTKVEIERSKWQTVAIGSPILLTLLFGGLHYWLRRRKYGR